MTLLYFSGERAMDRWEKIQPINFLDILAAAVVEEDRDAESPWHDDDGWKHKFTQRRNLPDRISIDDARLAAGWTGDGLVAVDLDVVKKVWMGNYSKASGEHKQVYEERMAAVRRKVVEQLVKWYKHGWDAWGVVCAFGGETASLWGIYDDRDGEHLEACRREMAEDVASVLAKRGRVIINKPLRLSTPRIPARKANFRNHFARKLGFEEYRLYSRWVRTPCRWGDLPYVLTTRRRGWPRKDEQARIYRDKDKQSYFIVIVSADEPRCGARMAIANTLVGPLPSLASTDISTAYISQNWLKRVAWDELPGNWQRAFRSWLDAEPAAIHGFWRVGEQPV